MKTILLIESNIPLLENLTEGLELEGYMILACDNGRKGIELAEEFVPDLIISAIEMRELNGYEVLRLLLNSSRAFKIPFIFSTTKSEQKDRKEALFLGADDYIIKPYKFESLLSMSKVWIKSGTRRSPVIGVPVAATTEIISLR